MSRKDNAGHEGYYRIIVHGYSNRVVEVLGEENVKLVENGAKRRKLYTLFLPSGTIYTPGKTDLKPGEYYSEEFELPNGAVIVCSTRDTSFTASVKRGTYAGA